MKNMTPVVSLCVSVAFGWLRAADVPILVPAPRAVTMTEGICRLKEIAIERVSGMPKEGYELDIRPDGVMVRSSDAAGEFYARMTLRQIERYDAASKETVLPCLKIKDFPRYVWRGLLIDDCRHFFGKETVKRVLDLMAQHKLNVLHWHLTDDQGWRLDIPGHPELVQYGAVRSQSVRHGCHAKSGDKADADKFNGIKYGPFFYSETDLREILDYAAERHVKVVPEIELPGHVQAVLAAYPELACNPENVADRDPRISWGISRDVLCLGNDKSVRLFEDVLDYVCRIFPSDVVHIGGDECPQERWKICPKCQSRIRSEGLNDERGLQPWVTRHFVKFLEARGKRALGWDEYLLGDVPKSAIGMRWRVGGGGAGHKCLSPKEIVERGHDIVMTPVTHCYLDFGQGLVGDPFQYIGGCITLEKAYSLDLCAEVPAGLRSRVLGGQGNNWAEYTWNECDLEWKMWPRMCALAEVFWSGEDRPGFSDFRRRMQVHRKRLVAQHVNCAPLE